MENNREKTSLNKLSLKHNNPTFSPKSSDTSAENSHKNIFERKSIIDVSSSYKRDLGLANFTIKRAIKCVGEWVMNVQNNRNLQMRSDFDEEKEFKLEKKKEIQNHIEELSKYYEGENKITYFNNKINQHKELYKKYTEIKDKIDEKLKLLKDMIPDLEKKIFNYKMELKKMNKENLKLMGQVNKFENELSIKLEEDLETLNNNLDKNNSSESRTLNISQMTSANNSSFINNNINVEEILDKNENLKQKNEKIIALKEYL